MSFKKSGQLSEQIEQWPTGDAPEPTLERRLLASQYLVEHGLAGGSLEDIAYRVTVKLAQERKASRDIYELLSSEAMKWKTRFKLEHHVAEGLLEDNAELEWQLEAAEAEADFNVDALITAQERLDNALATYDAIAPFIDWAAMIGDHS